MLLALDPCKLYLEKLLHCKLKELARRNILPYFSLAKLLLTADAALQDKVQGRNDAIRGLFVELAHVFVLTQLRVVLLDLRFI